MNTNNNRLPVTYDGNWIYDICLTSSYEMILDEIKKLGYKENTKICIVTDSNVEKIYEKELKSKLQKGFSKVVSFIFDAGEESKNLNIVQKLYEHLITHHFDRSDLLIALGGGVVGDMTGFTAATYLRGIDFIQVPTTLLSQVDSSIGGKTGVDFSQYKNMVGAFKQPKLVYINLNVLKTLPKEQFASGMAEAIKSGLIKDASYYTFLIEQITSIQNIHEPEITKTVAGSCKIKREVVQNDPTEKGERALLNFGHTIGHAIEKLSDFSLYHGECVALGMVAATYMSWKMGNLEKETLDSIEQLLSAYQLPIRLDSSYAMSVENILLATKSDKKMEKGQIKFVLLKEIGNAYISREVTDDMLKEGISYILTSK